MPQKDSTAFVSFIKGCVNLLLLVLFVLNSLTRAEYNFWIRINKLLTHLSSCLWTSAKFKSVQSGLNLYNAQKAQNYTVACFLCVSARATVWLASKHLKYTSTPCTQTLNNVAARYQRTGRRVLFSPSFAYSTLTKRRALKTVVIGRAHKHTRSRGILRAHVGHVTLRPCTYQAPLHTQNRRRCDLNIKRVEFSSRAGGGRFSFNASHSA